MSRKGFVLPVLLCTLVPAGAGAAPRVLKGRVVLEGSRGEPKSAARVAVVLTETGARDFTDDQGVFHLPLLESFQPGETVHLTVQSDEKDWRLYAPLDGAVTIPANPDKQWLKLQLLPAGSKRFWTDERIEKFLKDRTSEARAQAIRTGEVVPVDLGRSIKDWAEAYGLDAREAQAEIDKWVASVEKRGADTERLALAAFARGQFKQASELLNELARKTDEQLEQKLAQVAELKAKSAHQHEAAGDADYNAKDFQKALAHYETALQHVSREDGSHHWVSLMLSAAVAHVAQAENDQGEAISQHYAAARQLHDVLLEACPRARMPQDWARIQNSRANALRSQSERATPAQAARLQREAVLAYHAALEELTREEVPQEWATTQKNLASALMRQGERSEGEEAARLLSESVSAYRAALEVLTREQWPEEWASAQSNLGIALLFQSKRVDARSAARLKEEAITACQAALEVRTREQYPLEWATTQNTLGNALLSQAEHADQDQGASLEAAARAYRAVLQVRTRERWPQAWALARGNLGNVLWRQGELAQEQSQALRLLAEAVDAYHAALAVLTREQVPQYWAMTQNNLASALLSWSRFAKRQEAVRLLGEATTASRAALDVFDREAGSSYWKHAHSTLLESWLALAEVHAASGAFSDMDTTLREALRDPDLDPKRSINLRTLDLVARLADPRPEAVASRLEALHALVSREPEARGWRWSRQEILTQVREDKRLAPFRGWLPLLLEAVNNQNRADLLFALEHARTALSR
jgi:hypothetical protein